MGPEGIARDLAIAWYMLQRILLQFALPIGLDAPDLDRSEVLAKVRTMINDQVNIVDPAVASLTWQATLDIQVILEMAGTALAALENDDEDGWKWRAEAAEYMCSVLITKLEHIIQHLDETERE